MSSKKYEKGSPTGSKAKLTGDHKDKEQPHDYKGKESHDHKGKEPHDHEGKEHHLDQKDEEQPSEVPAVAVSII